MQAAVPHRRGLRSRAKHLRGRRVPARPALFTNPRGVAWALLAFRCAWPCAYCRRRARRLSGGRAAPHLRDPLAARRAHRRSRSSPGRRPARSTVPRWRRAPSDFGDAGVDIARIWSELRVEKVFRSDMPVAARHRRGAGARLRARRTARPHDHDRLLRHVAARRRCCAAVFPTRGIADAIARGHLYAVAVTATSYHSGRSFTFVQGRPGHPVWTKSRRVVLPAVLTHRHVLASSAIPILFPPVRIDDHGAASCGSATARCAWSRR